MKLAKPWPSGKSKPITKARWAAMAKPIVSAILSAAQIKPIANPACWTFAGATVCGSSTVGAAIAGIFNYCAPLNAAITFTVSLGLTTTA